MIIPKTTFILSEDDFIVFLDIDGVLNSRTFRDWRVSSIGQKRRAYLQEHYEGLLFNELLLLDPLAVERLQKLVLATHCKIVISSTWREKSSPAHFAQLFELLGYPLPKNTIIGLTPIMDQIQEHKRGIEIETWINTHVFKGTYLALDDDCPSIFLEKQPLYSTKYKDGLTDNDVDNIVNIINSKNKR